MQYPIVGIPTTCKMSLGFMLKKHFENDGLVSITGYLGSFNCGMTTKKHHK